MADKDKDADEIMSDEELDKVAGGTLRESADDSRFLNVLLHGTDKYHQCDRYSGARIFFDGNAPVDIVNSWKSLGIEIEHNFSANTYMLHGKKISRAEAWAHAESLVGKHLTEAQWNW